MRTRISLWLVMAARAQAPRAGGANNRVAGKSQEELEKKGTNHSPHTLSGPHATMKIRAEGQVWDLTLAPSTRTERAGLTEKVIPVGAKVTVHGHRNRDPKRFEIKTERVTWNGRTFNVYPDRQ